MLVKELVFSILDTLKLSGSDDSYITPELVLFLCKKYRAFLIKKEQDKEKLASDIASEFEYQEICIDLVKDGTATCFGGQYLKSTKKIPKLLEGNKPKIYPEGFFEGANISFVSKDKMRYIGTNKYLQNIIYASIGPDFYLYVSSSNPQFAYLKKLRMSAIFEDPEEAAKLACPGDVTKSDTSCDIMEQEFPIREYLVPMLIELVTKELSPSVALMPDTQNDAADNTPELNRRGR